MNTIRFAAPDDAAALLRIYAQYIETPITFEYTLPSEEEFAQRILLTEVSVSPGGRFTAYYNDDDMFWVHAVEVSGSLKKGITYANLAG